MNGLGAIDTRKRPSFWGQILTLHPGGETWRFGIVERKTPASHAPLSNFICCIASLKHNNFNSPQKKIAELEYTVTLFPYQKQDREILTHGTPPQPQTKAI
jgi:hypothetical protein